MRLAYDRFEHFQAGLKRHQFSMRYRIGVERKTGLMQAFQADIVSNGGGRANCSDALTMVAATSAASIYYFPKTDVAATAMSSRALDCGSARGYGALETLGRDRDHGRRGRGRARPRPDRVPAAQRAQDRDEERPGRGARRPAARRDGAAEGAGPPAVDRPRARRKQAYDAANPGRYYGVGFGCIQRRFGDGAQCSLAKVELSADGRITLGHTGTEIGTGTSSGQAVACARWLGRPADVLEMAATDWPELPVETSGNPHAMAQEEQDRPGQNPRWVPVLRLGLERQQLVLLLHARHAGRGTRRLPYGLLPAAGGDLGRGGEARGGALA